LAAYPLHLNDGSAQRMSITRMPDGSGLKISGSLDRTTVPAVEQALRRATGMTRPLNLDLAELDFVDVGVTTALVCYARTHGGLIVHHPPKCLRRILQICFPNEPLDVRA
jgi:ABC-type transporter Mla MlaB component